MKTYKLVETTCCLLWIYTDSTRCDNGTRRRVNFELKSMVFSNFLGIILTSSATNLMQDKKGASSGTLMLFFQIFQ